MRNLANSLSPFATASGMPLQETHYSIPADIGASGEVLMLSESEKTGSLRTSRPPFAGRKDVAGRFAVLLATIACMPTAAPADEASYVTADVTLATDYVVRGASQTLSEAAIHGCVEAGHKSGLFGYLWGSNVDFVADGDPDDGARAEINAALGYEHALTDRLTASMQRIHYLFPDLEPGLDYDYAEWVGTVTLDERHSLAFGYTGDFSGTGGSAMYVDAATGFDLPAGLSLTVKAGWLDLERAFGEAYVYGTLAVSGSADAFSWEVSYHIADGSARDIFYEWVVAPRLVLSLNFSIG